MSVKILKQSFEVQSSKLWWGVGIDWLYLRKKKFYFSNKFFGADFFFIY